MKILKRKEVNKMFKKLIITGAAAAIMLSAAAGAFASSSVNNHASGISNLVVTVANTGFNQVNGSSSRHHSSSGLIMTGDAGASSLVGNVVNTTVSGGRHAPSVTNNASNVTNTVVTVANTGVNQVNGGGSIGTGNAGAQAGSFNVVNTTVSGL
jgi:hypothetical protein